MISYALLSNNSQRLRALSVATALYAALEREKGLIHADSHVPVMWNELEPNERAVYIGAAHEMLSKGVIK